MFMRTLRLSALAASVVLALSACDPSTPTAQSAGPASASVFAVPSPTGEVLPEAATGSQKVTLVAPSTVPSAAAAASGTAKASAAASPSKVPSAAPAAFGTAKASAASSPSPSGTPAVVAGAPDLKLDAYDKGTGKAVLAVADTGKGTPSPAATAAATAAVQVGQVIDSPPSAVAPHGALLAITDVKPAGGGKVAVSTRPASISELLGSAWANIKTALDPHKIQVTPKVKDLKASYVPKPDGGEGSASAVLQLDANATVPLPGGAKASLTGSLELDPSVMFSYQGTHGILAPEQAKVGFDLGARANWHLTAGLTGSTGQVKIPIATLTATPTVMVGTVPVVIVLNVTVYATAHADGTVSVDVTQEITGDWALHADYTKAGGWTSTTEPVKTSVSPVKASFEGRASVSAGLVAEGSVALYDTVGVKATVEPYLRADVDGSVSIDSSGGKPTVHGKAGLYGGLDVDGAVLARIAIMGTPLIEKDIPFKLYHNEWPIVAREFTSPTVGAQPSASPAN
ncbi:hypothetical protein ACWCXH_37655 [Kitasatospora sp. NPDC001660]